MKKIVCIALFLAAGCKKTEVPTVVNEMKTGDTTPVRYVNSLQKDVEKAQAVKDKANAAIQQNSSNIEEAGQ